MPNCTTPNDESIGNGLIDLKFTIATKKDLPVLNHLYADMNDRPLMSRSQITKVWHQIQQVPDYYIYLAHID